MERLFRGKPNISLTGFMFSGKSSVGRILARRLRLEFVDLDRVIEFEQGRSIHEIFKYGGEDEFRGIEKTLLAEVLENKAQVVSTGGGVVIDPDNRKKILEKSCVVWLKTSPETVYDRLINSRGAERPLLREDNPQKKILDLMDARKDYYSNCDLSIETDGLSPSEVAGRILEMLENTPA